MHSLSCPLFKSRFQMKKLSTLVVLYALLSFVQTVLADLPPFILDADTANEIDDLYAINRMLHQEQFHLKALNSAQWLHHLGDQDSVQASQRLNEDLVRLANKTIPTLLGATFPMGKPWGGFDPQDSPAAQFIIAQARSLPAETKLTVAAIGASTNIASAIKMAPDIAPKLRVYVMGFRYDAEKHIWNKSEFNIRRDLNAADFLLNQQKVELHIMPATTCEKFPFDRETTFEKNRLQGAMGEYLSQRWRDKCPEQKRRIMWDLALIEAILQPALATEILVGTPPENTPRKVYMYTDLKAGEMQADYWNATQQR
jgi:purine nucleosidase